jgi:hypothetical protein
MNSRLIIFVLPVHHSMLYALCSTLYALRSPFTTRSADLKWGQHDRPGSVLLTDYLFANQNSSTNIICWLKEFSYMSKILLSSNTILFLFNSFTLVIDYRFKIFHNTPAAFITGKGESIIEPVIKKGCFISGHSRRDPYKRGDYNCLVVRVFPSDTAVPFFRFDGDVIAVCEVLRGTEMIEC